MTPSELETALLSAFRQCAAKGEPVSDRQRQIILEAMLAILPVGENSSNPLDQLTATEQQALLVFVQQQEAAGKDWKATILNDWLREQDSGSVQFVRLKYGLEWLQQVAPKHLGQYDDSESLQLKVGDRIEVNNGLWEWVQEEGPCQREWFPCTVISVQPNPDDNQVVCTVRFEDGSEYEIQGVYDWNRPNWRWHPEP